MTRVPKLKRLQTRLTLLILLVTLITIGLTGILINRAIDQEFNDYLLERDRVRNQRIVEALADIYEKTGDFRALYAGAAHVGMMTGTIVEVYDNQGELVFDSQMACGMMGGGMMRGRWGTTSGDFYVADVPVVVRGERVGTARIYSPERVGIWSVEDLRYKWAVNRSMLTAGVLATLVAVALSLITARSITSPIKTLTRAARAFAAGDLNRRVTIKSGDEIAVLAENFNYMAARLERLEQLRKKLTADVAHELWTPLATVLSYIEGFQDGVVQPTEDNLAVVHSEVVRLKRLVEDIQELALTESGSLKLRRERFNLAELLSEVCERLDPLFREKGQSLIKEFGGEVQVLGDRDALSRAVRNVLYNAHKHTPEGTRVRESLTTEGDVAKLEVEDNGPGIPSDDLPYIFERFYKVDRSGTAGGTGIGLTIAKELVEAQGGRIEVRSVTGRGTTFTLYFPLEAQSVERRDRQAD